MEAPDKIYVHEISAEELTENFPYHVCYIRKDALLEWLEECKNNPVITDLQKGNIQELIDKINSL